MLPFIIVSAIPPLQIWPFVFLSSMSEVAHHLVRRGLQVTQAHYATSSDDETQIKQIAVWGMVLLWTTAVLYMAMVSAVSLTNSHFYGMTDSLRSLTLTETSLQLLP